MQMTLSVQSTIYCKFIMLSELTFLAQLPCFKIKMLISSSQSCKSLWETVLYIQLSLRHHHLKSLQAAHTTSFPKRTHHLSPNLLSALDSWHYSHSPVLQDRRKESFWISSCHLVHNSCLVDISQNDCLFFLPTQPSFRFSSLLTYLTKATTITSWLATRIPIFHSLFFRPRGTILSF